MAVARAKGKLRGKKPKLSPKQQAELRRMHATGDYEIADLTELFSVSRPTVYRTLQRAAAGQSTLTDLLCTSGQLREFRASMASRSSAGGFLSELRHTARDQ